MSSHCPSEAAIVARLRASGSVFAEDEAALLVDAARTPAELGAMVDQRVAGRPLEQILGWVEFCGRRIAVEPGVFVPRRRTEFLVHEAAAACRRTGRRAGRPVVVDLCCGCGAVGAVLAAEPGGIDLYAVDIEPAAVRCARVNIAAGGRVLEGDLCEPLPDELRGRVDVLVANAPYVPTDAIALMPPEARLHEPRVALDGGPDGLDVARRVTAEAVRWLAPGGHLLIETSRRQAPRLAQVMAAHHLIPRISRSDELDATVAVGRQPSPGRRDGGPRRIR